jgi:hypothetical protein
VHEARSGTDAKVRVPDELLATRRRAAEEQLHARPPRGQASGGPPTKRPSAWRIRRRTCELLEPVITASGSRPATCLPVWRKLQLSEHELAAG